MNCLLWFSMPSLVSKSRSHVASFAAAVRAVYSDWHVDSKTVTCSFNFYEIGLLFNINTKLDTECLVVLFCP